MKVIDLLNRAREEGRTLFGFELLPPLKGDGCQHIFKAIDNVLPYKPAYINITYHREVIKKTYNEHGEPEFHTLRKRPGTVGIAGVIQRRYGIPVVPHLICGGMSKYDIEDALIDLDFLGIDNILALRGDRRPNESQFIAHPDGHEHAIDLVRQIKAMNNGEFIDGEIENCHHTQFCIGVAGYPETHENAFSPEDDIRRLKQKVDAGAEYVVTQMFFDNRYFFSFVEKCRAAGITVPIIPGLKPLVSERQLITLPDAFSIRIPEELKKEIRSRRGDRESIRKSGIEWTLKQAEELKENGVEAIHFYTMSKTDNIARIASQLW